jgi:hypothetical protein
LPYKHFTFYVVPDFRLFVGGECDNHLL